MVNNFLAECLTKSTGIPFILIDINLYEDITSSNLRRALNWSSNIKFVGLHLYKMSDNNLYCQVR